MKVSTSILGILVVMFLVSCANDSVKENVNGNEEKAENQDVSTPKESKTISDISKETDIQQQDCEDKFKNEQGICEVPNPEYPKELRDKKNKKDDDQ